MTIHASAVAEKLGGSETLGRPVHTLSELRHAVEDGLPVGALDAISEYLAGPSGPASTFKYTVVPKTTLRRRTRLSPEESERTERIARTVALAEQVWEDADLAREFLTEPQPQLGGERPIDLARSELGAREVEALLMRIEYALPA